MAFWPISRLHSAITRQLKEPIAGTPPYGTEVPGYVGKRNSYLGHTVRGSEILYQNMGSGVSCRLDYCIFRYIRRPRETPISDVRLGLLRVEIMR